MPRARTKGKRPYDLTDRTAKFAEAIIRFAKKVPKNAVTLPLIRQIVKAGTSVGANYREANDAVSRRDFRQEFQHRRQGKVGMRACGSDASCGEAAL